MPGLMDEGRQDQMEGSDVPSDGDNDDVNQPNGTKSRFVQDIPRSI